MNCRLFLIAVFVLAAGGVSVHAQDDKPKQPTPQQQEQLEKADRLNKEVFQLWKAGKYQEAIPPAQEALKIRREILGEMHKDTEKSICNLAAQYQSLGEYAKAEPLMLQDLDFCKKVLGEQHPDYATSLNNLGVLYLSMGEYAKAEPLFLQALNIRKKVLGEQHTDYAGSLNNLALLYNKMGKYAKAEPLLLQALDISKKVFGEKHPDYITSLNNVAKLYVSMGEYSKAERLYLQVIDLWKKLRGEQHPNYAVSLINLAALYTTMGEYAKAEPLDLQARDICKKTLGEQHPFYATSLINLADIYMSKGEYAKAESLLLQVCEIRKKVLGEQHPDYPQSLRNLAGLYKTMGDYAKAEAFGLQACEIYKEILGEHHPEYATSLSNLAGLYVEMGEYSKAEKIFLQAHDITKKVLGEKHPHYAVSLNNLGFLYMSRGNYTKAKSLYLQALDIFKKEQGCELPSYAQSLENLGSLYKSMGDYTKAKPLFHQSLDIRKKVLGDRHPKYAQSLHNMAGLYMKIGEDTKAESLYLQAVDISKKTLGEQHPNQIASLNDLGVLYESREDYAKAELLFLQVLVLRKKVQGDQHPEYARSLGNLAFVYMKKGEYAKAEPLFLQARDIRKKVIGEQHPEYADSLSHLAVFYISMGEYVKAEAFIVQALDIEKKVLGEQHLNYAGSLCNLSGLYIWNGKYAKAADLAEQASKIRYDRAITLFAAVSEAEALNYATKNLKTPNGLLSASRYSDMPADRLYANVWRCRGLIQQITSKRQQQLQAVDKTEVRQSYQKYMDTRRMLARLILSPVDSNPERLVANRKRMEELTEEKERLERQLAAELPEFDQQLKAQRRPHTELTAQLPPDTVFIDFLRYAYLEMDPNKKGKAGERLTDTYAAFLLRPGKPTVRVELGPVTPIDAAIVRWLEEIAKGSSGTAATELRKLVWEPLEKQLPPGTKTVYLCPDDKLTSLPWAALPGEKTGTVLLEEYALAIVPYGQLLLEQLVNASQPSADEHGVLLAVGGVAYDDQPSAVAPKSEMLVQRSAVRGDKQVSWPTLPGTQRELESVVGLAGKRTIARFDGATAGTAAVLAKLPEVRWAHFATHGFFADPKFRSALQVDEKSFEQSGLILGGERRTVAGRNPLVLSGLVLAGANRPQEKDTYDVPQGDGGILTAEAIAALPLDKLELAVLSACETGLGDVAGGEGVFGLQRAFHLAGTRNVVATLWKVDDNATAALMQLFYHNFWANKLPPLEALRQAQLAIYRHPELIKMAATSRGLDFQQAAKLPKDEQKPNFHTATIKQWAAFVLSGSGQ